MKRMIAVLLILTSFFAAYAEKIILDCEGTFADSNIFLLFDISDDTLAQDIEKLKETNPETDFSKIKTIVRIVGTASNGIDRELIGMAVAQTSVKDLVSGKEKMPAIVLTTTPETQYLFMMDFVFYRKLAEWNVDLILNEVDENGKATPAILASVLKGIEVK